MKNQIYFLLFCGVFLFGCKSNHEITASDAKDMIEAHLENNPVFETGSFDTSKMRINLRKEKELAENLEQLVEEGYVRIENEKRRKKFLSKDSVWIVEPVLTEKALPYVVKQGRRSTEVITIEYKINPNKEVLFNNKGKSSATCTAVLDKQRTPFYMFGKDANPSSGFITRKFKLKYNQEEGWYIP